jgi:hypothetical protein
MKVATVCSVCECQARLAADLDENLHVIRGWARDPRRRQEQASPANTTTSVNQSFDVGWFCPFCIRNTLRSFDASSLGWREAPGEKLGAQP